MANLCAMLSFPRTYLAGKLLRVKSYRAGSQTPLGLVGGLTLLFHHVDRMS